MGEQKTRKKHQKNTPPHTILIKLDGDLKTQFDALHEKYGFTSKVNTIRHLITEKYHDYEKTGQL